MRSVSPVGSRNRIGFSERSGRRAEQRDGGFDRVAQACRAEVRRVDRRAQLVAVLEHEAAGVGPGRGLAVVHRRELAARAQRRGEAARCLRARQRLLRRRRLPRRRAFDADENEARGRAALQLVEQHRLLRRRRRGQERREVGDVVGAPGDDERRRNGRQPDHDRRAAARDRLLPAHRRAGVTARRGWSRPARSSSPTGRRRRAGRGPRGRRTRAPRRAPMRPGRAGAGRAARARASTGEQSPATRVSNRRSSAARLPVKRAADRLDDDRRFGRGVELHRPAALAEAHRQRVAVARRASRGAASASRGRSTSGALNERRPDDVSVRSSISIRRVSTKVASPDGRGRAMPSAPRDRTLPPMCGAARAPSPRPARCAPSAAATTRRRSGCGIRRGRTVGIGPEVVEVEPVVRRLAAQRLEGRDVALERRRGSPRRAPPHPSARWRRDGRSRRARRSADRSRGRRGRGRP